MTLAEARTILITYKMPMTAAQLALYKKALAMVSGGFLGPL